MAQLNGSMANLSSTALSALDQLAQQGRQRVLGVGERLMRPDQFSAWIYRLEEGDVRLLVRSLQGGGPITVAHLQAGSWLGWSSLLLGSPCEWASCSSRVTVTAVPAEGAAQALWQQPALMQAVLDLEHPALKASVARQWLKQQTQPPAAADALLRQLTTAGRLDTLVEGAHPTAGEPGWLALTGCDAFQDLPVAALLQPEHPVHRSNGKPQPLLRLWLPSAAMTSTEGTATAAPRPALKLVSNGTSVEAAIPDAYSLGLRDDSSASLAERYPERRGVGRHGSRLAVIEMLAAATQVPFRRDQVDKLLRSLEQRGKDLTLAHLARIAQGMGLMARPAAIEPNQLGAVRPPLLVLDNGEPLLLHALEGRRAVVGDGRSGLRRLDLEQLPRQGEKVEFVLVNRLDSSPSDTFNWAWIWPMVRRYRGALVLVLVVSLVAQLFSLGVPLLLQQLIDKVLTQGNLSSLNALAGLMVAFALFQGVLTALRTFLFVDTTDRIDLTLGSAVIDRLLRLPLGYYEKRPIGELSQRLGELNNIRSFLTGTAITTVLDLLFSTIYLAVMLSYSAGLTAIALSTFPIYLILTVGVSPIYKRQLRERAKAQARTQSHLIEVIGGIQTVKAQHGELRARWKWQERYQQFVEQSYKSVILGTTTGQIGSFLNTLSGLLILWAGLSMVLKGEFTLGQLLAFRIFAGYVTQPLLRLSNLWQGIQGVNLSMERLADIVNQPAEAGPTDAEQLALPPIEGAVRFERIGFRFGSQGPRQLDGVDLAVEAGEFVGVVGLSGSGKSTLMKLLVRLYPPEEGRILIDGNDIAKVQLSSLRSQVGIVPQDSMLFEGTVAENIALNDPNVDSQAIVEAAKLACAHEFIMELPDGYATRVAEKGANLSGGQRQRLALARMALEAPAMLVMDEATSALDADTERRVCANLQRAFRGRTVFYVTHRLATVMGADRVVVLDKGRVVEEGSPQQLLELQGLFAALWAQQAS